MFVFISEIFPNAVRAKGQALGTFVHWAMATTVTWSFPVVAKQHVAAAFGFFAAMMVLQFFFAWQIMPETKGGAGRDAAAALRGRKSLAADRNLSVSETVGGDSCRRLPADPKSATGVASYKALNAVVNCPAGFVQSTL